MRFRLLFAFLFVSPLANAAMSVISGDAAFQNVAHDEQSVSFDIFPVGFNPSTSLQLGDVSVVLTQAGSSPIFGPGSLFDFPTNFLSTGVEPGGNEVVITFPAGTCVGGMQLVSVFPITLTAVAAGGARMTVDFSSSTLAFLAFSSDREIASITVSSRPATNTPIVNIGDISYAPALVTPRKGPRACTRRSSDDLRED